MTSLSEVCARIAREHTVISLPLRVPFRGLTHRESVLFPGSVGWGEFAPFDDYSRSMAMRWMWAAAESAFAGWPLTSTQFIRVNAIIPALPITELAQSVRSAVQNYGCTTIKIKVAADDQDVDRVRIVREQLDALAVDGSIRVDVNGGWTFDRALATMHELEALGIEYVEQPCAELADCERLSELVSVPVFVDEAVRTADRPEVVAPRVAGVVGKVGPLGGVRRTIDLARTWGLPMTVSSALDSSVGLSAGVAAAAHFPERAHGLGTGALFAEDVVADPLIPSQGRLAVGARVPDPNLLQRAAARVNPERRAFWRERVEETLVAIQANPTAADLWESMCVGSERLGE